MDQRQATLGRVVSESQCGNRNWSVISLLVLQRNVNGIGKKKQIKAQGRASKPARPRGCCCTTPTRFSDGQWSV